MLGMSRQEMFDKIVNHLKTQKERSYDNDSYFCMYRGPNGLKCAVGALIPDNMYKSAMDFGNYPARPNDGVTVFCLYRKFPELQINADDISFLTELQEIHDDGYSWNNSGFNAWDKIRDFAEEYNLQYHE